MEEACTLQQGELSVSAAATGVLAIDNATRERGRC